MKSSTEPKFIIFGDSHSGALRRAAEQLGVAHIGSPMFAGKGFEGPFFSISDGHILLHCDRTVGTFLEMSAALDDGAHSSLPILSTAGFNSHRFAKRFARQRFSLEPRRNRQFISSACFEAAVEARSQEVIRFYQILVERGRRVYAVYSPQRFDSKSALVAHSFEAVFARKLLAIGLEVVDVRAKTVDEHGVLQERFARPEDSFHGNEEFGKVVIRRFLEMIGEEVPVDFGIDQLSSVPRYRLSSLIAGK